MVLAVRQEGAGLFRQIAEKADDFVPYLQISLVFPVSGGYIPGEHPEIDINCKAKFNDPKIGDPEYRADNDNDQPYEQQETAEVIASVSALHKNGKSVS